MLLKKKKKKKKRCVIVVKKKKVLERERERERQTENWGRVWKWEAPFFFCSSSFAFDGGILLILKN